MASRKGASDDDISFFKFTGQPWSSWANKFEKKLPNIKSKERQKVPSGDDKCSADSVKLAVKDKSLFGICPAQDEFYLVVCESCGQVVKPQALNLHIEMRHKSLHKIDSTPLAVDCVKSPGSPETIAAESNASSGSWGSSRSHSSHTSTQAVEKGNLSARHDGPSKNKSHQESKNSASPSKKSKNKSSVRSGSSSRSEDRSSYQEEKPNANSSKHHHESKSSSNTYKSSENSPSKKSVKDIEGNRSEKEFNSERHCGVVVSETFLPCIRSLACKLHSTLLKRKVPRKRPFDVLLQELKGVSNEHSEKIVHLLDTSESSLVLTKETPELKTSGTVLPDKSGSNQKHLEELPPAFATTPIKSVIQFPLPRTTPWTALNQPSGMLCGSEAVRYASSDEDDLPDNRSNLPFLPYQPRPAAINTFGGRIAGTGCLVFSRRNDFLRCAVGAALRKTEISSDDPLSVPVERALSSYLSQRGHMETERKSSLKKAESKPSKRHKKGKICDSSITRQLRSDSLMI